MNTWGKFLITSILATGFVACGEHSPVATSQASNDDLITTKKTATVQNPEKNHTLSIGGKIKPFTPPAFKTSIANLNTFDTSDKAEKKIVVKSPAFRITQENLSKLTNLTLDLSKEGFYDDKIEIESSAEGSPNCVIVAGWKIPNTDETQSVTFKLVFENNELNFSNLEIENPICSDVASIFGCLSDIEKTVYIMQYIFSTISINNRTGNLSQIRQLF